MIGEGVHRRRWVPAALVVAVLITGCAANQQQGTAAGAPVRPAPNSGKAQVAGGQLPTVTGSPTDQTPLPWSLDRVDQAAHRVYLSITGQGCSEPRDVAVIESGDSIVINAYGNTPSTNLCTEQAVTITGYVTTGIAPGNRKIIHGT